MDLAATLASQYRAALRMLELAIEGCPEPLWLAPGTGANPFWRVAYHALYYTHLYLQPTEADFRPWSEHRAQSHFLGTQPWPPFEPAEVGEPYTREQLLSYLALCREELAARLAGLDPEAPSGFDWLPFDKLELQLYSIRHIQQHAGELMERLAREAGVSVDWVGRG